MRGSRSEPQEGTISERMQRQTKRKISVKSWPKRSAQAPIEGAAAKRAAWIGSQGDLLDGPSIQQFKSVEGIRAAGWQKKRAGKTIWQKPGFFRCNDVVVRGDSDTTAAGMLE